MKKVKPLESKAFSNTVRWQGWPLSEMVARVIAFGSGIASSVACWNQSSNKLIGSAVRSSRCNPLVEYSFLKSERSMALM